MELLQDSWLLTTAIISQFGLLCQKKKFNNERIKIWLITYKKNVIKNKFGPKEEEAEVETN